MKDTCKILFIVCIAIISNSSNAQTLTQTVKGKITDAQTGEALIGAHAILLNADSTVGTVTDVHGNFRLLNIPVGRASFEFSYLGYEHYTAAEIIIGSAKEVNLTIRLTEALDQLEEIVIAAQKDNITPNNKIATVSARSFSVEETKRFPASISDPARMALSYAGVTNSDDQSNEIIIRGNAPNQLLWRIEGVEVPDPNHFSEEGYSTGAVSILNTNLLAKSDFFTGAFPAEYGNALSGVFDINLRNGNKDKREYAFQFGVLGTDLTAEGPFKKGYGGSYLVNYRYSTLTVLNNVIDIADGSIPTFQDFSFKVNLPMGKKSNLSIWAIGGLSEDNSDEENDGKFIYSEIFESKTYMSGATFSHSFESGSKIESRISFTGNSSDYIGSEKEIESGDIFSDSDILRNNAVRFSTDYAKKFNAKTFVKTGVIVSLLDFNVKTIEIEKNIKDVQVDEKGTGTMLQAFIQAKHRFNNNLSGVFGIHASSFSINKNTVVEPRAGLEWYINDRHTLSAGFGVHSRRMPLNQYFIKTADVNNNTITPNRNIDLMQAIHYVIGYDWRVIKNGHVKIEAYYQKLNKVAVIKDTRFTGAISNGGLIDAELIDTGIGENYGVELTFEKFFSKQYYFLVTASLFDSKYKASNGKWYNSAFNYNYTFNVVAGKEFIIGRKQNNTLGINGKILTNGGKRGTPFDQKIYDETGNFSNDQSLRNTTQYDPYFRIDASIYYRLNRKKVAHRISLDLQNATDNLNVAFQFVSPKTGKLVTHYQLGLLPIINYKIEF